MARIALILGLALLAASCDSPSEPPPAPGPPFLAIVTKIEQGTPSDSGARYVYRVRNLSVGTTPLDTLIPTTPRDTVILSLPASTYSVRLDSLPSTCDSRRGPEELVVLDPQSNTGLARFFMFCNATLTIGVETQGPNPASEYVWSVTGPDGTSTTGVVDATGAAFAEGLLPGSYDVALALVPPGCIGATSGGLKQRVTVTEAGGARVNFRVICSDPAKAPVVQSFHWSYHDSTAAFVAVVTDPNRDAAAYTFDLTDCAGTSILPSGRLFEDHLDAGRTARQDSLTIVAAFDLGLPADAVADACAYFRVDDVQGNSTRRIEVPLEQAPGSPPSADEFNARLNGETLLRIALTVSDPDSDFVGTFATLRIRDGILHPADGQDDLISYNIQGFLGDQLPDASLGSRFTFNDVYAVIVYLIDAQGHFTRLEDGDTFQ